MVMSMAVHVTAANMGTNQYEMPNMLTDWPSRQVLFEQSMERDRDGSSVVVRGPLVYRLGCESCKRARGL